MLKNPWIFLILVVGAIALFVRNKNSFSGLGSQRGIFGTSSTAVDA